MVLPGVARADIGRADADNVYRRHLRQAAGPVDPGAAVDAERIAHIVRVVVADDKLHRPVRGEPAEQQPAQVVIVAAAGEDRACE